MSKNYEIRMYNFYSAIVTFGELKKDLGLHKYIPFLSDSFLHI